MFLHQFWPWFAQIFTILVIVRFLLERLGLPIVEHNSTTLICRDLRAQQAVTCALQPYIGKRVLRLDTDHVSRRFLQDGTSIDTLTPYTMDSPQPYAPTALKQIVLPIWSRANPEKVAKEIGGRLGVGGYSHYLMSQPDPEFPKGSIVILLSNAFDNFGVIIRKNALRIGGKKPKRY